MASKGMLPSILAQWPIVIIGLGIALNLIWMGAVVWLTIWLLDIF
jgi:hypothetical protein